MLRIGRTVDGVEHDGQVRALRAAPPGLFRQHGDRHPTQDLEGGGVGHEVDRVLAGAVGAAPPLAAGHFAHGAFDGLGGRGEQVEQVVVTHDERLIARQFFDGPVISASFAVPSFKLCPYCPLCASVLVT